MPPLFCILHTPVCIMRETTGARMPPSCHCGCPHPAHYPPARHGRSTSPLCPLQEAVDLIEECVSTDPQQRPLAAAVLARLRSCAGE